MRVLMISTDRKIFEEGSAVRQRMIEYGELFEHLDIVIFSKQKISAEGAVISSRVTAYSTNSFSRFSCISDAVRLGSRLVTTNNSVISTQDPFETGLAGYRIAKAFSIPLHVQVHTDFLSPYFSRGHFLNRFRARLARYILRRADGVRVVSKRIAESMQKKRIILKKLPAILPIFTDYAHFENAPHSDFLHNKYPQFSLFLLMTSRLTAEKKIEDGIKAFAIVRKSYPQVALIIVGSGPELGNLRAVAHRHGVTEGVYFEGWQNDLLPYYKSATIFLQTSLYEGYGLSLIEAVASGLSAVSYDVGVASELIDHDSDSLVCRVGDHNNLASKVLLLLRDNQLRERKIYMAREALHALVPPSNAAYLDAYKKDIEATT